LELWKNSLPKFDPPQGLENYFNEPQRHYHNMFHISRLLKENKNLSDMMLLSIWFHDIIYDPKSKENE
jgi:predicted metal-dependent HD superfamily phosphohydrolase